MPTLARCTNTLLTPRELTSRTSRGSRPARTWQIEFIDALVPIDGELVVRKRAVSGFVGTELDRLLRIHDISTLVVTGIITNFAAEGSARDASDRGFRVIVLTDCCESMTDEMHQFSITQILPLVWQVASAADFIGAIADI